MNASYHWMHLSTIGTVDISNHDKRALSNHTSLVCPPLRAAAMLEDAWTRVHASSVAPVNRDLNSAKMHFWSKFGNPDFNQWWLIARTNSQTQTGVNLYFGLQFDLEDQGQSPTKTTGILTKVFYIYGPNLVILAWTGGELSREQTWWRTNCTV